MKKHESYGSILHNMAKEWKFVFFYARKYRVALFLYVLFGIVATIISLSVSIAAKYLIDAVVGKDDSALGFGVLVISLGIGQHIFQALASYVTADLNARTVVELRKEIYSRVINAKWEEISCFHSGDLINRLESDVNSVSNGIISFIPGVITKLLQFIGSLIIVLYYDNTMAVLSLLSAPFLFFSSRFLIKTIRKYSQQSREINGEILSYSEESMQNILTIKAFDLTRKYIADFGRVLQTYRDVKLKYDKFSILMTLCLSLIGLIVSYICYGWGVYRLWQGAITFGTMTLFIQISGMLTSSFSSLASLVPSAVSIATSAGRIMEITTFDEEKDANKEKALSIIEKSKDKGISVKIENLSFKYKGAESETLKNVSLKINPGETVAIIGASGEGKTTFLKLILGIMSATQGEIEFETFDGEKIQVSDSTRRFCSYVPQGINIFSGTIRENMLGVKPDATENELYQVLELSALSDFVKSLPLGLDTPINEQGNNFSQGQLQRIAISRALLKESMVLLMDEATSALDSETEKAVLENIMSNRTSKTTIITTHRESVLKYCDRVFSIDETGEFSELIFKK